MSNLTAIPLQLEDEVHLCPHPSGGVRSELTGDLGDFSVTDILQILSHTRKTGTLLVEGDGQVGTIVVEDGRIVCAVLRPGESFVDRLVRENWLSARVLRQLREMGRKAGGLWTLQALLIESGAMPAEELKIVARRQFQLVLGALISLREGGFSIDLNQTLLPEPLDEVTLDDGFDVGELLMAAVGGPEGGCEGEDGFVSFDDTDVSDWVDTLKLDAWQPDETTDPAHGLPAGNVIPFSTPPVNRQRLTAEERSLLLLSLLTEMRRQTEEIEILLLLMRYAGEVAARGILFSVFEQAVCGVGQFGIESPEPGLCPDTLVREIRIPVGEGSLFDTVLWTGQPFLGPLPHNHHHREMLKKIGGSGSELSAFALPLYRNGGPVILFYGDNFPGADELTGFDGLVALVTQASLALEKLDLERRLKQV